MGHLGRHPHTSRAKCSHMTGDVPFPRIYRCCVPRKQYLELLEVSQSSFAGIYHGFESFHSLFLLVNAAGKTVIHGEGVVKDMMLLKQCRSIEFMWEHEQKTVFIAAMNQPTHIETGQRLKSMNWPLRVLSVQWGERGLEMSFYVHNKEAMNWDFFQQAIAYLVDINTTEPVDVFAEQQTDVEDLNLLRLAFFSGYFENPRLLTLTELGRRAGLSSNTVNRRLRRIIGDVVKQRISPQVRHGVVLSPWQRCVRDADPSASRSMHVRSRRISEFPSLLGLHPVACRRPLMNGG